MEPGFAEVHETHSGVVFLVGDRAYKLKKPVDLGFLDFTTPEKRMAACRRELDLNRRLAPDVYLGLAEVSSVDGAPVEPLLVMRRMPDERRLSTLVRAGEPVTDVIDRLARIVAAFHAAAERGPEISAEGRRDAILNRWTASFDQVRQLGILDNGLVAEIERLTRDFLAGRRPLFDRRIATRRIVDGHGDLLTGDIFCLPDGPRVLDCLEFDDRLRWVDGLDDIAFLAMDLEHLGAPALAARLLEHYTSFAGDPAPISLRHHYIAYRAFVRAKVDCLRATQGDTASAKTARDYADLALAHLRDGRPRLILVGGLPGTGKSTLAGLLADHLGGVLLSSDRLRKELAGRTPDSYAGAGYRDGIYSPEHTHRTYSALLDRAEELLGHGETVVLDASWTHAEEQERAAGLGIRTHTETVALRCAAHPTSPRDASAPATAARPTPIPPSPPRWPPTPTRGLPP